MLVWGSWYDDKMRKHITDHAKCITERFRFGQLCELIIDMRLYDKALHASCNLILLLADFIIQAV